MIFQERTAEETAAILLQVQAVKLRPDHPFTWASGMKSPVYCDNRVILSFPDARKKVANFFAEVIHEKFAATTCIAGVATGAIAHGMLVAEILQLPFVYVRSAAKEHGLGNMVEGRVPENSQVLVIEDLVSTGNSSLKAVEALRQAGVNVLGMVSVFDYGFQKAVTNFSAHQCTLYSLSNYDFLVRSAVKTGYITQEQFHKLEGWRSDPEHWYTTQNI